MNKANSEPLSAKVDVLRKKMHINELNSTLRTKRDSLGKPSNEEEQSFVRIIRDGVAEQVRSAILEAKREIEQHRKLDRLNRTAIGWALEFYELSDRFIEKKTLLERVEKALDEFRKKNAAEQLDAVNQKKLDLAVNNARHLRNETVKLMDEVLTKYNRLDAQIRKDRETESNLRKTFEKCITHLTANEKRRFDTMVRSKLEKLPLEARISLLTKVIEQLAHSVPAIRREEVERLLLASKQSYEKGNYQVSLKTLEQLFNFDRKHLEAHRLRAQIYDQLKNRFAYICELRMISEIPHAEGKDFHTLAQELLKDKKLDDAIALYEKAVEREPVKDYLMILGDLCMERRIWYRAVQVFEQILCKSPRANLVRHKMGQALFEINQETEAFDVLRKAVKNKDDQSLSRVYLGRIYRKRFMFNEAVDCFNRAIELDEKSSEGYYWFGMMLFDEGKFDDAFDKAKQVIAYEPDRNRNKLFYARCCNAIGDFSDSIKALKPLLDEGSPSIDIVLTYSEACKNVRALDEAIKAVEAIVKKYPRQPQMRSEFGMLLLESGRYEEAAEYLKPAV